MTLYEQIAKHCGKDTLTSEEIEIINHTEMAATSSYKRQGITAPPANLLGQITWLLVQNNLYRGEQGGG